MSTYSNRLPKGFFVLGRGRGASLPDDLVGRPTVAGATYRVRWSELEPKTGRLNWQKLDDGFRQCDRFGKQVKILVQTGRDGMTPGWIGGSWARAGGQTAPLPWSPELAAALRKMTVRLGERYADHPRLSCVHVTGPTWPSAEMHPMPGLERERGYSAANMVAAWKAAVDAWGGAFPHCACALSLSVQSPVDGFVEAVIDYGRAVLGDRFIAEHNALSAKPTLARYTLHRRLLALRNEGVHIAFEQLCSAFHEPSRYGSADPMAGVEVGVAAGAAFIDVYPPDVPRLK